MQIIFNNTHSTVNIFSLPYYFLNSIFFSLAYFILRIQYIIHITYKTYAGWLFMLSVRLPVSSRLIVVKFGGSQKLYTDFQRCGVLVPATFMSFKSQLYSQILFWTWRLHFLSDWSPIPHSTSPHFYHSPQVSTSQYSCWALQPWTQQKILPQSLQEITSSTYFPILTKSVCNVYNHTHLFSYITEEEWTLLSLKT